MKIDGKIHHNWTIDEIVQRHQLPLLELIGRANGVHRQHHDPNHVQKASLLSIKTGSCPEDCGYCPQSAHHKEVSLDKEKFLTPDRVIEMAKTAKNAGATRFCMGAAWRSVRDGKEFDAVIEMVKGVSNLGMEACVTLGMLKPHQAQRLADAGLKAYNHNLDTSPEYYKKIITTRNYQDRLDTLATVRETGVELCTGGIIGMGETVDDRASMLKVLSDLDPHPESVPINALVPVPGTPLGKRPPIEPMQFVRMIATTRLVLPKSIVRLSAGRTMLNRETQLLCLLAGANSIFYGEKLLTTANVDIGDDAELLATIASQQTAPPNAIEMD